MSTLAAPATAATAGRTDPSAPEAPRRVLALDALRGMAILAMVLSGVVPAVYPAWMHHAQCPPPTLAFNPNLPGITWVDLVFPFFLFSMGAAIPLALSRRIEQGCAWWKIGWAAFQRFLLLGLFACYVEHMRPWGLGEPTWKTWTFALATFAMLFLILVRLPKGWSGGTVLVMRAIGWAGAIALMWALPRVGGKSFDPMANDIIILILANVVLGVSLAWLLTRGNLLMRLACLGILLAIGLSAGAGANWVGAAWNWSPEAWLYGQTVFGHHLYVTKGAWLFHQSWNRYLFIAIPGTIVGDLLLAWVKAPRDARDEKPPWPALRWWGIAGLSFALVPVLTWGLFTRQVWQTFAVSVAMCVVIGVMVRKPSGATERLVRDIVNWGAFWLMLGLLFEPYEGGIKKDPATMSYFFVSAGLARYVLVAFTALADALRKPGALRLLADNGQNPMIAYVGLSNLVTPVLFLVGINPLVNRWVGHNANREFIHGAVATFLLALVVSGFTRAKVFWRT